MEYNNLSKEMQSLQVPSDKSSGRWGTIATPDESRNITKSFNQKSSSQFSLHSNYNSINYSTMDTKVLNKNLPFLDSTDYCSGGECLYSRRSAEEMLWRPKVHKTRAMEAKIHHPQHYFHTSTG